MRFFRHLAVGVLIIGLAAVASAGDKNMKLMKEVEALESLDDWLDYARTHSIDYVVFAMEQLEEAEIEAVQLVYRNRYFGVADINTPVGR